MTKPDWYERLSAMASGDAGTFGFPEAIAACLADYDRLERDNREYLENLTAVQSRCNVLLDESRALQRIVDGRAKLPTLNVLRDRALHIAVEHGFTDASVLEDFALMHSEISEATEDSRAGHAPTDVWYEARTQIDKPCGIPSEMADVIIRVLHFCGKHGIDIEGAVTEKMTFNASRPFKHGKTI